MAGTDHAVWTCSEAAECSAVMHAGLGVTCAICVGRAQVHIITAACENMIDGRGMRPGDILQASNGKTVEVGGV